MKKAFKNLTHTIIPVFTLVLGISIGIHYLDFQNEVLSFVNDKTPQYQETIKDLIGVEEDPIATDTKSDSVDGDYVLPVRSEIEISRLWQVWDAVREKFFVKKKVSSEDVLYGMISGMVDSLGDDYTMFFSTDESEDFDIEVNGELEGIGAELTFTKKALIVVDVIKNSPAYEAGLKPDDIVIDVDGDNPSDIGFHPAIKKIRGPKGTQVSVTIIRPKTGETIELLITRDKINVQNIVWESIEGVAYIAVNRFSHDLEQELREVATEILAYDPEGIVLDVRDNGGGYMDQAIVLANAFISDGLIVSRKFRDGTEDDFYATSETLFKDYPLVVLMNGNSASASEIVAGAIQDTKTGVLMGENSYGKGSVQEKFDIAGASLKITVANWYTPNDRNINDIGLTPDIEVKITEEEFLDAKENNKDIYLEEAIKYLINK